MEIIILIAVVFVFIAVVYMVRRRRHNHTGPLPEITYDDVVRNSAPLSSAVLEVSLMRTPRV